MPIKFRAQVHQTAASDPSEAAPRTESAVGGRDFPRLYRDHAAKVARWAARLGGPFVEPLDIVQEVFEAAHRRLSTLRPDVSPATWLFAITRNTVLASRRKQRLRGWVSSILPGTLDRTSGGPLPTPLESLERREAAMKIHRLLEALPERQRTAFLLYELEGLSSEEVATLMSAPVGTTRLWLFRARAKFVGLMENET
jgi:RNA polymerase sigma-70 factor (ECF subfamily)